MYKNKFSKLNKSRNDIQKNEGKRNLSFKEIKLQMNITVFSICMVVLVTLGSSYAAFVWNDNASTNDTVATGTYEINISDSSPDTNGTINLASAYPMTDEEGINSTPYKFTITNSGSHSISYTLKLSDDTATISEDNCSGNLMERDYIKMNMGGDTSSTILLSTLTDNILDSGTLKTGESKSYDLRLWLKDQVPNEVIGRHFHGKLEVETKQLTIRNTTLVDAIKKDNTLSTTTPDFSQAATTNEGLLRDYDDDGPTYYFRGAVENNYVKFDGLKWPNTDINEETGKIYHSAGEDMLWRIVRINGDGTIRLIADGSIGKSAFNEITNAIKYVGYTFLDDEGNVQDSTVKTVLDKWYNDNMTDYDKYIVASKFCNDTSIIYDDGAGHITYGASDRIENLNPSLKCPNTTKNYGGLYTNLKVGLITADEVMFAGGSSKSSNISFYLYGKSNYFCTLSPDGYGGYSGVLMFSENSDIKRDDVSYGSAVRPVINLKSDTLITSGTGTISDPYVVGGK